LFGIGEQRRLRKRERKRKERRGGKEGSGANDTDFS
jgi:hypothetical protein